MVEPKPAIYATLDYSSAFVMNDCVEVNAQWLVTIQFEREHAGTIHVVTWRTLISYAGGSNPGASSPLIGEAIMLVDLTL